MAVTKEQVQEKIKELYVFNASLEEEDVKKKRKKLYKDITLHYKNWEKALMSCGITKRKLREREKFILYFLLKGRLEKYGPEALRHKNVQPLEVKERIVHSFKTIKALRDIVLTWDEDKVLYELHAAFLHGAEVNRLEEEHPELYEQMMDYFEDLQDVLQQYNKRFGLPNIAPNHMLEQLADEEDDEEENEEENEEEKAVISPKPTKEPVKKVVMEQKQTAPVALAQNDDLIEMMIKLNYIDNEEDAQAILQASRLTKEDVVAYLLEALGEAKRSGVKVTEEHVRSEQPAFYFAIKAHYQNLENAFHALTIALVELK